MVDDKKSWDISSQLWSRCILHSWGFVTDRMYRVSVKTQCDIEMLLLLRVKIIA